MEGRKIWADFVGNAQIIRGDKTNDAVRGCAIVRLQVNVIKKIFLILQEMQSEDSFTGAFQGGAGLFRTRINNCDNALTWKENVCTMEEKFYLINNLTRGA